MTQKENEPTKDNLKNIEPIDVILVTFNRLNFLRHTVKKIYERTRYPYRLWIIDNASTDGSGDWLKQAKLHGFVYDYIVMEENEGLAAGFSEGFSKVRSEYFITTQDDVIPPDLKPCWLERMLHLAKKYPEYGGISMRVQRLRHREINELEEKIESKPSLASVYRIQKKTDIELADGFGYRPHWESTEFARRMELIKKKVAVATHLYADHTGFMPDNKGFKDGFTNYHTYAKERVTQGRDQPYPEIDKKTNIPLKIHTHRDRSEQQKRQDYWDYWGVDKRHNSILTTEQQMLGKYCQTGKGLDVGCGAVKCHQNAIGMDIFPFKATDILGDIRDLWMFNDNELDFIVSSHSLEHLPDTKAVLKEWKRVLKPGGILAIAVPDGGLRPRMILGSHKVALTKPVLFKIFKNVLVFRNIKIIDVPGKGRRYVFIISGKK